MNSFDKKRIDEPDFERRMSVFKKIRDLVKEEKEVDSIVIKAIFFNCCHYVKNETDNALKSNGLEALLDIAKIVKKIFEVDPGTAKTLIDKLFLKEIRSGIRLKDDTVRCDYLSFLHALVLNCSEVTARLRDLSKYVQSIDLKKVSFAFSD